MVGAPELYWRIEPGFTADHDEEGLGTAYEVAGRLDLPAAVRDTVAAFDALDAQREVVGYPGVIGYCLGGTIAWMAAAVGNPAVCVSYYGSGVADALDERDAIHCPTLLHFGGRGPLHRPRGPRPGGRGGGRRGPLRGARPRGGRPRLRERPGPRLPPARAAARSRALTLAFLARHHRG